MPPFMPPAVAFIAVVIAGLLTALASSCAEPARRMPPGMPRPLPDVALRGVGPPPPDPPLSVSVLHGDSTAAAAPPVPGDGCARPTRIALESTADATRFIPSGRGPAAD